MSGIMFDSGEQQWVKHGPAFEELIVVGMRV